MGATEDAAMRRFAAAAHHVEPIDRPWCVQAPEDWESII
jgi:hypothetical protein